MENILLKGNFTIKDISVGDLLSISTSDDNWYKVKRVNIDDDSTDVIHLPDNHPYNGVSTIPWERLKKMKPKTFREVFENGRI